MRTGTQIPDTHIRSECAWKLPVIPVLGRQRGGVSRGSCRAKYSSCRTQGSLRDCLSTLNGEQSRKTSDTNIGFHVHLHKCTCPSTHIHKCTYEPPLQKKFQSFMALMISQTQVIVILTSLYE